MPMYLGIDTSNYTTSAALFDTDKKTVRQYKKLLPVKIGGVGLRQSEAVFYHTKQLNEVMEGLFDKPYAVDGIGVSVRPRSTEDSYMPCFLVGENLSKSLSFVLGCKVYETSHQAGHVLAALYSANKLCYINKRFIAFHVSGGTTDCLLVEPDETEIIKITRIASSLDLKAGQLIDRVGVMLGMQFPCGKEMDMLSLESNKNYKVKPVLKGLDCCISGFENICARMIKNNENPADISNYCISSIYSTIREMTVNVLSRLGDLPLIYAGGVMSNSMIKKRILNEFSASFAEPEFSCDNAAGAAILASLFSEGKKDG